MRSAGYQLFVQVPLVAALTLIGIGLLPETLAEIPDLNDNVLHLTLARAASDALEHGGNPTDPWVPEIAGGYPVMHHYQHLPHVVLALLHRASFGAVSLQAWLRLTTWLLVLLLPLSLAWSSRRLGLDPLAAGFAGVAAALISAPGLSGLELSSVGWAGLGLTTQLWGVVLMGPVWVGLVRALQGRGGVAVAAGGLALLIVTHALLAWVTLFSGLVWALVPAQQLSQSWHRWAPRRLARLAAVYALAAVAASYFVVPFLLDRAALNRSVWEPVEKVDGQGAAWTLGRLFRGDMFDHGEQMFRAPVLTVLLLSGAVWLAVRWRRQAALRPILVLFVAWMLLLFGRPTWGGLFDLLPLGSHLHVHRLIVPVQWCGAALIGVALATAWRAGVGRAPSRRRLMAASVVLVILLAPGMLERFTHLRARWAWVSATEAAVAADDGAVGRVLSAARASGPGRIYAGRASNWGDAYRLGAVPIYALLPAAGLDTLGYLYHAMALTGDIDAFVDPARPAHFDLFNVRYLLTPPMMAPPSEAQLLESEARHRLYELPSAGYQALVDVPAAFQGTQAEWYGAARAWLGSGAVEARQHPALFVDRSASWSGPVQTLARLPALTETWPAETACGAVFSEEVARGRYAAQVDSRRACWLMLKATFHPGWRVWIDGSERQPVMVAPSFIAAPIEAGVHAVEWRYDPGGWRPLLLLLGGLAVGGLHAFERRRRQRATTAS